MNYGLWMSATGLLTNQYRQTILANNLANVNTVGFKRDLAVIRERPVESVERPEPSFRHQLLDRMTGGSLVAPTYTVTEQGPLEITNRPYDAALKGQGYFAVRQDNDIRYTRDGRFARAADGTLVTSAGGLPVLDGDGAPIRLPGNGNIKISENGTIRQNDAVVGELGVYEFDDSDNRGSPIKIGDGLYRATEPPRRATAGTTSQVIGGAVENSNADPVSGLAAMIETTRAYQLNASMISMQDRLLGTAVSEVGRLT